MMNKETRDAIITSRWAEEVAQECANAAMQVEHGEEASNADQ